MDEKERMDQKRRYEIKVDLFFRVRLLNQWDFVFKKCFKKYLTKNNIFGRLIKVS